MRDLVVVGSAETELAALEVLLWGLPRGFPLPVVVVPPRVDPTVGTATSLVEKLQSLSSLPVSVLEDKETLLPGRIYLCPPDYHVLVDETSCSLSIEAPVSNARPAIDVLFESAADTHGDRLIGILMSSLPAMPAMSAMSDGTQGLRAIVERGGLALSHTQLSLSEIGKKLSDATSQEDR